jgi:ABC-type sugar transport system permease subunit
METTLERIPFTARERRQDWLYKHRHAVTAWIILVPVLVYFFIFAFVPVLLNLGLSFTRWNGITGSPLWVGLDNYTRYLSAPYPLIIVNTIFFASIILVVQTLLAFFIAMLLNQRVFGLGVYRALWYIPTLTSAAIMSQVVLIFFAPYKGVVNNIIESFGGQPIVWTIDAFWMRIIIILYTVWRSLGGPIVLFLAALQGIHRELYEAAMVDGANGRQLLRFITIPSMRPMILFILVTGFIGNFQIFEAILLISKGGPSNQTNVMLVQIYNDAFTNLNLGVAAAGAVIMMIVLSGFSFLAVRLMNRETEEVS